MLELRPSLWTLNLAQSVIVPENLAPLIDHTCLDPKASDEDIENACEEALQFGFASVCVSSRHIKRASEALRGSNVFPIAVVGFPLGSQDEQIKVNEALFCITHGAMEIDMVLSIGDLKAKNNKAVSSEIASVVRESAKIAVKVILETSELSEEEIVRGCLLSEQSGARFVKTSTGFASGGATLGAVKLMHETVGQRLGVKASGGIRDFKFSKELISVGANRLGTSHGVRILKGLSKGEGY
jgi:deoxyribose-phosphate aldolase